MASCLQIPEGLEAYDQFGHLYLPGLVDLHYLHFHTSYCV